MKIHHVFYFFGVIFLFISVIYFTREFILNLPPSIKLVLLCVSIVATFIFSELLRERNL